MLKLWDEEEEKSWDNFHGYNNMLFFVGITFWLVLDLREPWKHEYGKVRRKKEINLLKMRETFFAQYTFK